jgi:hypothetical protein
MALNLSRLLYSPFFQNKFVLYGSLFVVLMSILRYLTHRNINAIVLMALIGLITSYFSKNMIIILLTAFASVFVLEMIGSPGVIEGLSTKEGNEGADDEKKKKKKDEEEEDDKPKKDESTEDKPKKKDKSKGDDVTESNSGMDTADKKKKSKQGMASLSPANYDGKSDEDTKGDTKNGNRIDYASTLEQAYDNIENIIGEDGVRGLTDQTKSLMHQQKELMNNMKDMGPLLKSAEGFMEQITGGGGIQGITQMLQGFATPASAKKKDKK